MGLGKVCPHCGTRSATLGGVCPACSRPYNPGGLLDRMPFLGSDRMPYRDAPVLVAFVAIGLFAGWLVLTLMHPVAGILVAALAFVLLVAAIGLANAAADRGR